MICFVEICFHSPFSLYIRNLFIFINKGIRINKLYMTIFNPMEDDIERHSFNKYFFIWLIVIKWPVIYTTIKINLHDYSHSKISYPITLKPSSFFDYELSAISMNAFCFFVNQRRI